MGQRMWSRFVQSVVLAVLALPLASAEGERVFSAEFETSGTSSLSGNLSASGALVVWQVNLGPAGTLDLPSADARLHLVNVPFEVVRLNLPATRPFTSSRALPEEPGPAIAFNHLRLAAGHGPSLVRFVPTASDTMIGSWSSNMLRFASPDATFPEDPNSTFAMVHEVAGYGMVPFGDFGVLSSGSTTEVRLDGPLAIAIAGPTVYLDGRAYQSGSAFNASRSAIDPGSGSGRYIYDNWVFVLETTGFAFTCHGCSSEVAWRAASGTLSGQAFWHGIQGSPRLDGVTLKEDPQTLEVNGTLDWSVQTGSRGAWTVSGPVRWTALDTSLMWTAAAVGLGGAAVGLTALLPWRARDLLTALLGKVTPRLVKADLLGNPSRRKILERMHAAQPLNVRDLSAQTGLSRTAVLYHLRILGAHDVLEASLPPGHSARNRMYYLNGGSMKFAAPLYQGVATTSANVLASAHSNPIRRAIVEALAQQGPLDFVGLRKALKERGAVGYWPQASAHHHLKTLEGSGAITSQWESRRKVYRCNVDAGGISLEQYRIFLKERQALDVAQFMEANGTVTESQLTEFIGGSRARHLIRSWIGLAILEPGVAKGTYALNPSIRDILQGPT